MDTEAVQQELKARQAALHDTLFEEDELGLVIRGQIHVEHEVIEFIKASLYPPHILETLNLDYRGKCDLALALGLPMETQAPLRFSGNLRNKFAHNLSVKIGKQEADNFHTSLCLKDKSYFEEAYHAIYIESRRRSDFWKTSSIGFDHKGRIVTYYILLWSGVAVATIKAKAEAKIV